MIAYALWLSSWRSLDSGRIDSRGCRLPRFLYDCGPLDDLDFVSGTAHCERLATSTRAAMLDVRRSSAQWFYERPASLEQTGNSGRC